MDRVEKKKEEQKVILSRCLIVIAATKKKKKVKTDGINVLPEWRSNNSVWLIEPAQSGTSCSIFSTGADCQWFGLQR